MNLPTIQSAIRHLKKNPRFAIFNVLGLTLGFVSFFFISLYVIDELKYDSFNANSENIFRIESHLKLGDAVSDYATAPPAVGANIVNALPDVVKSCRLLAEKGSRFELDNEYVTEDNVIYADKSILEVFTLPFIKGEPASALSEKNNIVISRSTAQKYFNSLSVIGKRMTLHKDDTAFSFKVSGVIENIPAQSHFKADFIIRIENLPVSGNDNFLSFYPFSTYILKSKSIHAKSLELKINTWIHSNIPDYGEIEKGGNEISFVLTPLSDIHLKSDKKYELNQNGNVQYVYIFSIAAIFVLCMAGINFMNLSLARFTKRAAEVAVKKVLGASAALLSRQFLIESIILCLVSMSVALMIGWSLIPYFNDISNKSTTFIDVLRSWSIPFLLATSVLIGVLSGAYPAIFMSSMNATNILSGKTIINTSRTSFNLRNLLLVTQFVVSTFLITGTIIVYKQLQFISEKDNGYDKEQLIVVRNASVLNDPQIFKQKALAIPGVISATFSNSLPTNNIRWSNFGVSTSASPIQTEFWPIDEDYIPTLGIKVEKGRNFDKSRASDSTAIILNESAYKAFALGDKIWSRPIAFTYRQQPIKYHVIGIAKDFHFNSLRQHIAPLVFVLADNNKAPLTIKCTNAVKAYNALVSSWNDLTPKEKMDVSFMDDDFKTIYREEALMGRLFLIFASLSIIIACVGLLGIVTYNISVRRKELAIRKTLGASGQSLSILLSKKYVLLILCSILLATPMVSYFASQWLQGFAYRYRTSYLDYLVAGVVSVLVSTLTLLFTLIAINRKKLLDNLKSAC